MENRLFEKKIELALDENTYGYNSLIKLEYYLLESKLEDMDELSGEKVYGIEIVKKVDGMEEEIKTIKNLFCCIDKTKAILERLARNTVTPMSLPFVLDDIIGI